MAKTKKKLLSEKDIEIMESYVDGSSGYFGKILSYLDKLIYEGVKNGKFTQEEAEEDLDIALWYSYGYNNIDNYEDYYRAMKWMEKSEKNAKGCGMWYYRYACSLIYCGKLEKALEYSEKGVKEDPDYSWGWLQLGRLRSHFGDKKGAIEAAAKGLELEPGDYEFLTLQKDLAEGKTLTQMEYHYIDADCDNDLQKGLDPELVSKNQSVLGIELDEKGEKERKNIFSPKNWQEDHPYCTFNCDIDGHDIEYVFRMNKAFFSKMDKKWLTALCNNIKDGNYPLTVESDIVKCDLISVVVTRYYSVELIFHAPKNNIFFPIYAGEKEIINKIDTKKIEKAYLEIVEKNEPKICR